MAAATCCQQHRSAVCVSFQVLLHVILSELRGIQPSAAVYESFLVMSGLPTNVISSQVNNYTSESITSHTVTLV